MTCSPVLSPKKRRLGTPLLGAVLWLAAVTPRAVAAQLPDGPWMQLAEPEAAGWSAEALEEARRYAAEIGTTAAMVVEDGRVVAAWGDVSIPHNVYSIRKSLVGALVGNAVARGEIDLAATLEDVGVDDEPPLTEQERSARIVDLLRARSGVYHPAAYETSGTEKYRPERDSHPPGTFWFYNNWDFNALSTVYAKLTGQDVFRAFAREIARPLGMEDFREDAHTRYQVERDKSIHPAHLFFLSARDLARFGQLWLEDGSWAGQQIVPERWIRASVTSYSEAFDGGYGYMSWWIYPASFADEFGYATLRNYDSFMTTGSGGQSLWIVPDLELVFVHLHERVDDSTVGAPAYWTLLDRIIAARAGSAYRGSESSPGGATHEGPLVELRPEHLDPRGSSSR